MVLLLMIKGSIFKGLTVSFHRSRSFVENQALSDMFTITDKPAEQHSR